MAYKINISGEIGWDYTAQNIRDSLREASGEDLDIDIVTPGGSVFDGIEIYNAIRDYKKTNKKAQILGTLKGLVASMGTYIASNSAFDLVAAEDNAVYMIHNPWAVTWGDYREAQTTADMLKGLADILSDAYAKKTKKSKADIRSMMDATTWIFGDDIKAQGFVDEIIPSDSSDGDGDNDSKKSKALAHARASFDAMISAQAKRTDPKQDAKRAAAMVRDISASLPGLTGSNNIAPSQGGKEDTELKNLTEFMAQGAEALAEVEALKADSIKAERERVKMLNDQRTKFAKLGAAVELIDNAVASGESWNDIAANVASLALAALDSPGPLDAGHLDSASGEADAGAKPNDYRAPAIIDK